VFINKPYTKCPKCGKNRFGVLMINSGSYVKRCASCLNKSSFSLPSISKKLIYLDQMVVSEIAKVLNPSDRANSRVDPYWLEVFEKLDHLVKLQLIVCPQSFTHQEESLVAGDRYKPFRRIYQLLSHGVSFYDSSTIQRFQTHHALLKWLGESENKNLATNDVTNENIDKWQSRMLIDVDLAGDRVEEYARQIREDRQRVITGFRDICEFWKTQKHKTFTNFYEDERSAYGVNIIREYERSVQQVAEIELGVRPMDIGVFMSANSVLMTQLHRDLERRGVGENEQFKKTTEFLYSDELKEIPYLKISAMMFASLARQFSVGGRTKSLSQGMMNDINVIASLAPYCDVMFMDNECKTIVSQNQSKVGLSLKARLFSQNKKQGFIDYLDEIENNADHKHLELVKKVYGEDWGKPYLEIFQHEF